MKKLFIITFLLFNIYVIKAQERCNVDSLLPNSIELLDGSVYRFQEDSDKLIVLSFWETICPHCKKMMPLLKINSLKYDTSKVTFLAVSPESITTVKNFLDSDTIASNYKFSANQLAFDMVFQKLKSKKWNKGFRFRGYPMNIILSADKDILFFRKGNKKGTIKEMNKILKPEIKL